MRREARKWDWAALVTDTHPDDLEARIFAKQCWVPILGKHRNRDAAWDMFEAMSATRH
ncbi:hypothetical protein X727_33560 [Mesorhizobium sp. L103C119B0]|nr:hypothetical protein X767_32835 [Mesorhizobium sp. LSJC264A00]ESZ54132.1 hypothetical protein X727_33560 [Mesorhizobium sp. L103C119B0]